jgi:hypothetical protein
MTAPTPVRRPSHELLMEAQEKLSRARDAEQDAGNRGVAMILNDLALALFKVALDDEIDEAANRACDARFPGGAR